MNTIKNSQTHFKGTIKHNRTLSEIRKYAYSNDLKHEYRTIKKKISNTPNLNLFVRILENITPYKSFHVTVKQYDDSGKISNAKDFIDTRDKTLGEYGYNILKNIVDKIKS